ncbi:PLP-dependent aminotransferase family protein [Deinococcus maricopensis]|uniref:Transcriptional regulator, GntR family with aminotransferase domain protein n=1 Tax=Deinococcus maricopensis (strain DSM 21211 / LMG 22137 / NRRL B-23946 / LB-34) TaxID=709986 RepID=E8U8G4_DEIML|nr:PLP-dependent aminotransferase family protein [Deinococcus maricopensis]ADV67353.1 transcriptional regulator, GntR family with aminotransferase domain protein [Deinococcus maricopensis DSM 21211]
MRAHPPPLLDAEPGETQARRAYRSLRTAILDGQARAGDRLPGVRALAAHWGLARNTVADAFERLHTEGFLHTRERSGTFISHAGRPATTPPPAERAPLSAWARRALAGDHPDAGQPSPLDFRLGRTPTGLFPSRAWALSLARRAPDAARATPHDPLGPLETRSALSAHLARERGIQATPDMIMLTGGTAASLDALARTYLEPGRVVALEDPAYPPARAVFQATGATLAPVPVDQDGLRPHDLPDDASLLFLTPAHQFPTGAHLSAPRRLQVLAWADRARAWIIEDDYDSDFRFDARPAAALQGLAPHAVLHVGSFSVSLAPAVRAGFLVAPEHVLDTLARTRPLAARAPATLDALALADFIGGGGYARHVRRARTHVAERHAALRAALQRHLPDWALPGTHGGLHLAARLPPPLTEDAVQARAARAGIGVSVLGAYTSRPHDPTILLAYAHLTPDDIERGVRTLARAVHQPT